MGSQDFWSLLPLWVKYIAMDGDGTWYCYSHKPVLYGATWDIENKDSLKKCRIRKLSTLLRKAASLQERPKHD